MKKKLSAFYLLRFRVFWFGGITEPLNSNSCGISWLLGMNKAAYAQDEEESTYEELLSRHRSVRKMPKQQRKKPGKDK